jgi:hypothetical protein
MPDKLVRPRLKAKAGLARTYSEPKERIPLAKPGGRL